VRYGIAIDTGNCMACYNCYMACKDEHCGFSTAVSAPQPHENHPWIQIYDYERGNDNRRIKTATVPTPCSHCADAPCAKAAKNCAVYTRPDGIVIIDPVKAKGQKAIADACPIGAISWNEELALPQKCTMCAHLLDEGYREPRCVEACPNDALVFGDLDDPDSEIARRIAAGRVTQLEALKGVRTNVVHLNIPTVFLAGSVYLPDDEVAIGAVVTLRGEDGEEIAVRTNDFGDWEAEWLRKGAVYDIRIELSGYRTETLHVCADTDRFVGEVFLRKDEE
jgi:Fe-S-cluster-containing dehydrogenase component